MGTVTVFLMMLSGGLSVDAITDDCRLRKATDDMVASTVERARALNKRRVLKSGQHETLV